MTIFLTIVLLFVLYRYLHWKLVATAFSAWMIENNFRTPSESDMLRLVRWCAENYAKDFLGKSSNR